MALLGDDLPARRLDATVLVARPDLCLATNEMNCVTLSGTPCCPCTVQRAACGVQLANLTRISCFRSWAATATAAQHQHHQAGLSSPSSRSCCRCCRSSAALIAAGASRARCGHKANQIATIVRNMLINFCCFPLLTSLSLSCEQF